MYGEHETHRLNHTRFVLALVIALSPIVMLGCGWSYPKMAGSGFGSEPANVLSSLLSESEIAAELEIFARENCLLTNAEQIGLPKTRLRLKVSAFRFLVVDLTTEKDSPPKSINVDSVVIRYSADSILEGDDSKDTTATSGWSVFIPISLPPEDTLLPRFARIEYYRHSIDQGPESPEPQVYLPPTGTNTNLSIIATPLHIEVTTGDDQPEPVTCGPYAAYFHYSDSAIVCDSIAAITAEAQGVHSGDPEQAAGHPTPECYTVTYLDHDYFDYAVIRLKAVNGKEFILVSKEVDSLKNIQPEGFEKIQPGASYALMLERVQNPPRLQVMLRSNFRDIRSYYVYDDRFDSDDSADIAENLFWADGKIVVPVYESDDVIDRFVKSHCAQADCDD